MIRFIAFPALAAAMALAALAGEELKPRDLTPVTWLEPPSHPPVEIVRNGKPVAVVYVAEPRDPVNDWKEKFDYDRFNEIWGDIVPPPALPRLLHELGEVVRLATGARLEFVTTPPAPDKPAIVIGDCEESRKAGIDANAIPIEGFVVKTAPNRVYLVGSTKPYPQPQGRNALASDATAWAVADFLERFAGVRWYWRAESGGRSIPRIPSLAIPPVHYRDQPVFHMRQHSRTVNPLLALAFEGHNNGDQMPLPFAPGVFRDYSSKTAPDGDKPGGYHDQGTCYMFAIQQPLMRHGSSLDFQPGLTQGQWGGFAMSREEKDPLYREAVFALKEDGTRDKHRNCYSAPETLDAYVATLKRYWDSGKRVGYTHNIIADSSCTVYVPRHRCCCERCRETTAKGGEALLMCLFAQRLCEAVKERWPDKKVVMEPFEKECPKGMKFPDNLVVASVYPEGYSLGRVMHPSYGSKFDETLRAWGAVQMWTGAFGPSDWTYGPVQYPHLVQDFYLRKRPFIRGCYLTTYNARIWVTSAPTFYVWMRVLWNPELDVDATLDEMCRRLFGPAAATAREFMRLQCDRWEKTPLSRPLAAEDLYRDRAPGSVLAQELRLPEDLFREIWPPDVVARLKALRDKALKEIEQAGDAEARQAFLYWTWTFDAFLEEAQTLYRKQRAEYVRDTREAPFEPADKLPASLALDLGDGVDLKLALIKPGEFLMGSEANSWAHHRNEGPQHRVRITKPFYMGVYELTVAQYEAVMGKGSYERPRPMVRQHGSPVSFGRSDKPVPMANKPVERISWNQATDFCRRLSQKAGKTVRLPTEAEWEYACRAGTTTQWSFGDLDKLPAMSEYAWYGGGDKGVSGVQDVGGKKPNAWGLYDMHGNVAEWCQDRFAEDYYAWSPTDNPPGPETGMFRVLRGGFAYNLLYGRNAELARSARRTYGHPDIRCEEVGFRVVVEAGVEKK
jgi:formylglycine-generating enzyme required for sulfatase activity